MARYDGETDSGSWRVDHPSWDLYYWYGENKEFTTGKTGIWTTGVRCYSSSDLYNWDDLGLIIPPNNDDPDSPLSAKAKA